MILHGRARHVIVIICSVLTASTATTASAASNSTPESASWYLLTTKDGFAGEPTLEEHAIDFAAHSITQQDLVSNANDKNEIVFVDTDCSTKITPAESAEAGCAQVSSLKIKVISKTKLRYVIRNDGPAGSVTINVNAFAPKIQIMQSEPKPLAGKTLVVEIPSDATSATAVVTYAGRTFFFAAMTVIGQKRRCNPRPPVATLVNQTDLGGSDDGAALLCQFALT